VSSFFSAAIRIMNRLKYPQKFLLVGSLLLIPTIVLMVQYINSVNYDIAFAEAEQFGLQYNEPVIALLRDVQAHATYAHLELLDVDARYDQETQLLRQQIERHITAINTVDRALERELHATDAWIPVRDGWLTLASSYKTMTPEQSDRAHEVLIGQMLDLITVVGNNSNLILDPDIDSYYLMDTVITKLPLTTTYLSQLRTYAASALMGDETLQEAARTRLDLVTGLAEETTSANLTGYGYAFAYNQALQSRLEQRVNTVQQTTAAFLASASQLYPAMQTVEGLLGTTNNLIDSHFALYDIVADELNGLIQTRINGFEAQRNLVVAIALAAVAASAYFFVGFYLSVRRTIDNLSHASDIMISGQVGKAVRLDNRDELAEIVTAFNNVAAEMVAARDRALQANHLKDEFLATMSHELRTPLNSIIGYTGILTTGMRGKIDDVAKGMLLRIRESSQNLLSLINDILDIAKIEAGRMEIVDAPIATRAFLEQVQAQTDVLARDKELNFELVVDPSLPEAIVGDEDKIGQVLRNLLSNAIKFTDEGVVRLKATRKSQSIVFEVSDTGIGIPPQALDYIFDEFRQVDGSTRRVYGGTGLGLAIVRKFCLAMGGRIGVQSKLGAGSTFTVTLPLRVPEEDGIVLRRAEHDS
jgi:signal transduction histidine kinase